MNDLVNVTSVEIRYTSHSYKIHENHVGAPYGRRASRSCFFVSARSGGRPARGCDPGVTCARRRRRRAVRGRARGAPRRARRVCAVGVPESRPGTSKVGGLSSGLLPSFCTVLLHHSSRSAQAGRTLKPSPERLRWDFAFPSGARRRAPPRGRQTGRNREAGSGQGRCLGSSAHREVRRARSDGPEMVLTTA